MSIDSENRLLYLDFLRGIAISMVVVFHCAIFFQPTADAMKVFQYGAHGVQLFFMVSAITMCYMWDSRKGESRPILKFYTRRLLRIAPIFWFAIMFYGAIKYFESGYSGAWSIGWVELLTSLTLTHGFSPITNNAIVPGGWSIGVEIAFYFVFPLIAMRVKNNIHCILGAILCYFLLNIVSTEIVRVGGVSLEQELGSSVFNEYIYQSVLTQIPVFFFGLFVYRYFIKGETAGGWYVLLFFSAWLFVSFVLKYSSNFMARPFFWLVCLSLMLLIYFAFVKRVANPVVVFLGRMSYSLYIFHFAVLHYFHLVVPSYFRGTWLLFAFWTVVVFLFSVAVAEFSRRTLESWAAKASKHLVSMIKA